MKASLLGNVSLHARNLLLRLPYNRRNPSHSFTPLAASTQLRVSFYSSKASASSRVHEKNDAPEDAVDDDANTKGNAPEDPVDDDANTKGNAPEDAVDDDANTKELKKRVEKFMEGDGEAFISVFEAILERKLAKLQGKKVDETDEDLMEKICGKRAEPHSDDEDQDVELYSGESSDSDE